MIGHRGGHIGANLAKTDLKYVHWEPNMLAGIWAVFNLAVKEKSAHFRR